MGALALDLALVWAGVGLMAVAVVTDLRRREIDDWISVALLVLGALSLANQWLGLGAQAAWLCLVGAGAAVLLAAVLAAFKFEGGDIKVLGSCGLLVGWPYIIPLFVVMVVSGGIMGAVAMARRRGDNAQGPTPYAYGPAIAIGFLAVAVLRTLRYLNTVS
jgi:prepilin peptidase CpaA